VVDCAEFSGIPTINALTDDEHPCQILADLLTVKEALGGWEGKKIAFIGDGFSNMTISWMWAAKKLGFELAVALRFLREGRMQTLFIISGVSVGIAVIVFMSALLTGLQANLTKRVLSAQAHITLQPRDEIARPLRLGGKDLELAIVQMPLQRVRSIDQWQGLVRVLQDDPAIVAVSPVAAGSALAVRGDATRSVSIVGIEPDSYFRIVRLPDNIAAGTVRLSSQDIVIGTELARYLGIGVGDRLTLTAGARTSGALTVTGIFDLGNRQVNERYVYVPLRTAQSLLDLIEVLAAPAGQIKHRGRALHGHHSCVHGCSVPSSSTLIWSCTASSR